MQAEKKVGGRLLFSDRAFYPVIDGTVVLEDVYAALRSGHAADVPVIIGNNADELPLFGLILKPGLYQSLVKGAILRQLKKLGATSRQIKTLLNLYRGTLSPAQRATRWEYNSLFSDENFHIPATLLAEARLSSGNKTYFYCFSYPAPRIQAAVHVMELYFVFGTLGTADIAEMMQIPRTDEELRLSKAMMYAWTTFARTGDPNHPGLPGWPPYDLERRATMFLDLQPRVMDSPLDAIRYAWMEIVNSSIFRLNNPPKED
jgi:para-nitrobenzyl esterase